MFSRETLAGILLAKAQFFCNVQVDEKMRIGYSVKLGIDVRMDSYEFLSGMQRALRMYQKLSMVIRLNGEAMMTLWNHSSLY